jgi:hypothetical protein
MHVVVDRDVVEVRVVLHHLNPSLTVTLVGTVC